MGLCIKCKYHGLGTVRLSRCRKMQDGHVCLNEQNESVDYVTGEIGHPSCYEKNAFEECLLWEMVESEEENPDDGEEVPDNPDDGQEGAEGDGNPEGSDTPDEP